MAEFIKEHANVIEVSFEDNFSKFVNIQLKPNIEKLKESLEDKSMFG
jgi:isoleucyl-tRNA synthetase